MRSLEQVNIRTNVRTYVRTYSHTYVRDRPYIPSTTLLCEGIIKVEDWPTVLVGSIITLVELNKDNFVTKHSSNELNLFYVAH